jgi:serine/threonine protein kinase
MLVNKETLDIMVYDFGTTRVLSDDKFTPFSAFTPNYFAPEQLMGLGSWKN